MNSRLAYYAKLVLVCVIFRMLVGSWHTGMLDSTVFGFVFGAAMAERRGVEFGDWLDRPMLIAMAAIIGRVLLGQVVTQGSITPWTGAMALFVGFVLFRDFRGYRSS